MAIGPIKESQSFEQLMTIDFGQPTLRSFELGVTLGTGSFGRVRICTHKILKKSEIIRLKQLEHVASEKAILRILHHPFIVRLFTSFQDPKYLYLVLEYVVGGEFFTHLRRRTRFDNNVARFFSGQVVFMFEYLHGQDIVYRDLKPENLLLQASGYLKITDFGFAKKVTFKTYTLCGTPEYLAPEVLLNKGHGKAVDWWTLGILTYEMIVGQPPYIDENPMAIYQQILQGNLKFPRWIDRNAKSLISKLLCNDVSKRLGCLKDGAKDIKSHKWFVEFSFDQLLEKKIAAPIIPAVKSAVDTSQFDNYPDSKEEPPLPNFSGPDPFANF